MKVLFDGVNGLGKNLQNATRNERKKIREDKLAQFKDQAEAILGPSFYGNKWKANNKDDEKKDITKFYDRVLCKELKLAVADDM